MLDIGFNVLFIHPLFMHMLVPDISFFFSLPKTSDECEEKAELNYGGSEKHTVEDMLSVWGGFMLQIQKTVK